ncbi:glutamate-rich protein 2 isoform X1 [Pipistrellus kuhlii]|uniref:Glutamate rich 2 n=2 Tax=Pipistrellus kuhlii TaxID=59472 RepID=A0A7J7XU29_PIPKU|nr:glutamate-rich protein 2 isoform X1 [Pipistrellus kuhlii]XP_036277781.1 glutamate-rich protein 2 isoform X1 [Pipistrellus kuhlii]XP_045431414.1 glutamate-rich protein 2 isoform X1 [Pipistrellus kuhlii]XP_045431415.1 glutamate-rich protein 2 isoform X1 [Pipistrellus kuhlii]XP_045431416.1 glutamate-rich protein 2 isoform X1 [Pipistrellus kuhlii]KAF6353201.1 glutamate rich 2 [Pipistrellus kuhlii]
MIRLRGPQAGKRRRGRCGSPSPGPGVQPDSSLTSDPPGPAPGSANSGAPSRVGLCGPSAAGRHARRFGPTFCIPEIPRNYLDKTDAVKASKYRQNGKLLVFDPKEKVMIEANETMSEKNGREGEREREKDTSIDCLPHALRPGQGPGQAWSLQARKEVSSKNIEKKVFLKNTENKVSSKSIEHKDTETNLQSKLWSSSFLKERTGEVGKDEVIAEQEKNNENSLQVINDKLSESTKDDGEDDSSDENNEDSGPKKGIRAPLELMAEFLRAEMSQDYHLAKKLCQMILIYEPENPEAKEFLTLIEEMLLMEEAQNREEESEEDSSGESEGESSEEPSEESSDECEDG